MFLAEVSGVVVATQKAAGLEGVKFLLVTPLSDDRRPCGPPQVAADAVQAGPGELVYVCTGREASFALDEPFVPVDLAVVGHVDEVASASARKESPRPHVPPKRPAGRRH